MGDGVFAPVSKVVRDYTVSGLDVVGSWLDYRMREGAGRRSSHLDRIRPGVWPAAFTEELLRLLWILEHTVELHSELNETLDQIIDGQTLGAAELPQSSEEERHAPQA